MALKQLSTLIMMGSQQKRIIARTTYADFMAMTGVSRDYISEGANSEETNALARHPDHTLLYSPKQPHHVTSADDFLLFPTDRIRYPNAKAKKEALASSKQRKENQAKQWADEHAQRIAARFERAVEDVARALYEHDRINESWDDVKDTYLARGRVAAGVILSK